MMRRVGSRRGRRDCLRAGLALAGLGLLAGCGVLRPQSQLPRRVPRIGHLWAGPHQPHLVAAFRDQLGELGYVHGQTVTIEDRVAEGRPEPLPGFAAELVRLPADVIVTTGTPATLAARDATDAIPIVQATGTVDPVGGGIAASLARPGGNVTGLTTQTSSPLARKRLQLLTEAAPAVGRVAVLWNPGNTGKLIELREAEVAAAALGLTLQSVAVRGPGDFEGAFAAAIAGRAEALNTFSDPLTTVHAAPIADFALRSRLPSVFEPRQFAEAGGLLSYGPDNLDLHRRAAGYVDRILKGASPPTCRSSSRRSSTWSST